MHVALLVNQTEATDGNQDSIIFEPRERGKKRTVIVEGTFDDCQVQIEGQHPDGGAWISLGDDLNFTANGIVETDLVSAGINVRASITKVTTAVGESTDITVRIV